MKREVETLVNTRFEYIGSDTNISSGNEMMLFKGDDGKTYAIEVYEVEL